MILNIYDHKKVIKTYETDEYDLMWSTLEDVVATLDLDGLKNGSNAEILKLAADVVIHNLDTVRDLMKDIFDGITDEELRCTKVKEIARVLIDVLGYMIAQLNLVDNKGKK